MIRHKQSLRTTRLAACAISLLVLGTAAPGQQQREWQILIDPFGQEISPHLPTTDLNKLQDVRIDPELLEIVRHLDDPDFTAREQAAQSIVERAGDKTQLYAILDHGQLTVEQRYRLLKVVREYLLDMPCGAVGISMDPFQQVAAVQDGGVRVAELIPGMPAERVLQIGDRIMAIDGRVMNNRNDLIIYVQNKKPGDKVMMTVKRSRVNDRGELLLDENNRPITDELVLEVELGSFEAMRNARGVGGQTQASPVVAQRAREAAEVAGQFAPSAKTLRVTNQQGQAFAFSVPREFDDAGEPPDPRVETHYLVRNLLRDFELVDEGRIVITPELRRRWFQDLEIFRQVTAMGDLDDEEMLLLNQRIISRYSQLLNARMQKVMPAAP